MSTALSHVLPRIVRAAVLAVALVVAGPVAPLLTAPASASGAVDVTISEIDLDGPRISAVTVTVANESADVIRKLEVTFEGPTGWAVAPAVVEHKGALQPGDTLDAHFKIQVPEQREGFRIHRFSAVATYGGGDGNGSATGVRSVVQGQPLPDLASAFDNVGVTDESDPTAGDFDGDGNTFSAQKLADVGITPGATVSAVGADFVWPDVPAGTPDNATASGEAIELDGQGSRLAFLGSGSSFGASGTATIYYTDGTSSTGSFGFPNWSFQDATAYGATLVASADGRNRPDGYGNAGIPYRVFANSIPVDPGKTVDLVVLPSSPTLHVFDLQLVP